MVPSLKKTRLRNEIAMERSQLDRKHVVDELKRQLRELEQDEQRESDKKGGTSS